jgi:hypothetical protein
MHAAISHYYTDGKMIPLGELTADNLPWSGKVDAEPKVPGRCQPQVFKFRSNSSAQQTYISCLVVQSNLQVKDRNGGTIEYVLAFTLDL